MKLVKQSITLFLLVTMFLSGIPEPVFAELSTSAPLAQRSSVASGDESAYQFQISSPSLSIDQTFPFREALGGFILTVVAAKTPGMVVGEWRLCSAVDPAMPIPSPWYGPAPGTCQLVAKTTEMLYGSYGTFTFRTVGVPNTYPITRDIRMLPSNDFFVSVCGKNPCLASQRSALLAAPKDSNLRRVIAAAMWRWDTLNDANQKLAKKLRNQGFALNVVRRPSFLFVMGSGESTVMDVVQDLMKIDGDPNVVRQFKTMSHLTGSNMEHIALESAQRSTAISAGRLLTNSVEDQKFACKDAKSSSATPEKIAAICARPAFIRVVQATDLQYVVGLTKEERVYIRTRYLNGINNVLIPRSRTTIDNWSGTGWLVINPLSGNVESQISGGIFTEVGISGPCVIGAGGPCNGAETTNEGGRDPVDTATANTAVSALSSSAGLAATGAGLVSAGLIAVSTAKGVAVVTAMGIAVSVVGVAVLGVAVYTFRVVVPHTLPRAPQAPAVTVTVTNAPVTSTSPTSTDTGGGSDPGAPTDGGNLVGPEAAPSSSGLSQEITIGIVTGISGGSGSTGVSSGDAVSAPDGGTGDPAAGSAAGVGGAGDGSSSSSGDAASAPDGGAGDAGAGAAAGTF